jgi:hypothetical protein
MKNLRNVNAPPTADLVQYYIDSAYDKVVVVYNALTDITALAAALQAGQFDNIVYTQDIDTLAELNALVGENVASETYVLTQVTGLFDYKGTYNADTNTPDLDTAPSGIKQADVYVVSVAGTFFATALEVGDLLIANQDNPTTVGHWDIINRNIDSSSFATIAQGNLADTAVQPADNISVLTNDAGYEANAALASQAEAEAGVENTKTMTALRVAQAIAALGGGSSPLTTKGDLWGFTTVDARVAIGSNDYVLTADSAEAAGVKWADPGLAKITVVGGTTHTLVAADNGKELVFTNGSAIAITLPDGLEVGFQCIVKQAGAGVPTVTPSGADTVNGAGTGVTPSAQWKGLHLVKYDTGVWFATF